MPLGFSFGFLFAGGSSSAPSVAPLPRVPTMLWANETPLQLAGVVLQRPTGWLDGATRALPEVDRVPGYTGGRYGVLPTVGPLDITLTGVMLDVTLEQQRAALSALTDLFTGEVELRWPHAPTQVMRGMAGPITVEPFNPDKAFVLDRQRRVALRVTWNVRCADAARYERHPRRIRLGTTPKPIVMGGLPVGGEILLEGPLSGDVNIDILTPSGTLLDRIALRNVALASGDSATVRLDAPNTITKRTAAGVLTSVYSWRSLDASTRWWKANPYYADPDRDQWPLVKLSTGSGWWTYVVANSH
jgi:hypothetical protein